MFKIFNLRIILRMCKFISIMHVNVLILLRFYKKRLKAWPEACAWPAYQQMRGDFSNGPGQQKRNEFSQKPGMGYKKKKDE